MVKISNEDLRFASLVVDVPENVGILVLGYKKLYRYCITNFLTLKLLLCHLPQFYSFLTLHFGSNELQIPRIFLVTILFSTVNLGLEDSFPESERYFLPLRLSFTDLLAAFQYLFKNMFLIYSW